MYIFYITLVNDFYLDLSDHVCNQDPKGIHKFKDMLPRGCLRGIAAANYQNILTSCSITRTEISMY